MILNEKKRPEAVPAELQLFAEADLRTLLSGEVSILPEGVWLSVELERGELAAERFLLGEGGSAGDPEFRVDRERSVALRAGNSFVLAPSSLYRFSAEPGKPAEGRAGYYTIPSLYFHKKFNSYNGLGKPHSEVIYLKSEYLPLLGNRKPLKVLDLGCGRGRNGLLFAERGHDVLGIDLNAESLGAFSDMARREGLSGVKVLQADLNSWRGEAPHDLMMAIVSLQFLEAASAPDLLAHAMSQALPGALHLLVFPVLHPNPEVRLPQGFRFLPESEEVKRLYIRHGWQVLEYRESFGHLHKLGPDGLPIRGLFATGIFQAPA